MILKKQKAMTELLVAPSTEIPTAPKLKRSSNSDLHLPTEVVPRVQLLMQNFSRAPKNDVSVIEESDFKIFGQPK